MFRKTSGCVTVVRSVAYNTRYPQFELNQPRPLFQIFQTNKFYNKPIWKNAHPVYGTGFEPMTFQTWVITHNR